MRILVCYTRFPWPTVKGDILTVFKLLEFLGRRHVVDLLCCAPKDPRDVANLPSGLNRLEMVPNPLPSRMFRIGKALLTGECLQVGSFFPPKVAQLRRDMLRTGGYDLVYTHYIRSFGSKDFEAKPTKKVIGLQLSHQAHFAKAAANARDPLIRQLYRLETSRLRLWEGQIAAYNDLIHLISPKDLQRIEGHQQFASRVFFNPHGVDDTRFVPAPEKRLPGHVVFTGSLGFQANEDAILWFVDSIWPLTLQECPGAQLTVAGSNPTSRLVNAIRHAPRANLVANPRHMWEVTQTADVCIDPLRIGAGLQNKLLEALACGVPTVSTSLGNEGIGAGHGKEILLADDPGAFASAISSLMKNRELHGQLSIAGRSFIERLWSWDYHFQQLEDRWLSLVRA